jgi:hypothetical protein
LDFGLPSNPHLRPDLPYIPSEKGKLPEWNANNQHRQRPDNSDKKYVDDRPEPVLLNSDGIHDLLGYKTGGTASNSKRAKDQGQLQPAYFPFFSEPLKHNAAKVRKK